MGYINFKLLKEKNLSYSDYCFLCAINQIDLEEVETLPDSDYTRFKELSLVKHIKPKNKKESFLTSLRLDAKGKKLLTDLERSPEVIGDDIKIKDWLVEYYKSKGKEIGSHKRIEQYLVNLRLEAGLCRNNLAILFKDFLSEDYVDESSKVLESTLFQNLRAGLDKKGEKFYYNVSWNLEDSWIYKHYLKKEQYFKSIFEEY